jgi:hypothetical protein
MKTISKLKKELDKYFSLFIRLRSATDTGLCQCITCGTIKHYKSMQNGHFQSRRFLATRWSEEGNCEVQCQKCNIWEQGMQFRFSIYIDSKYGEGTAEHLEGLARTTIKISRIDYEEKISYYKKAVNKLKKEKGIE